MVSKRDALYELPYDEEPEWRRKERKWLCDRLWAYRADEGQAAFLAALYPPCRIALEKQGLLERTAKAPSSIIHSE